VNSTPDTGGTGGKTYSQKLTPIGNDNREGFTEFVNSRIATTRPELLDPLRIGATKPSRSFTAVGVRLISLLLFPGRNVPRMTSGLHIDEDVALVVPLGG
jgi:hypothetical protein